MLLKAPVASGYNRSCSTMWRSMVMTELLIVPPPKGSFKFSVSCFHLVGVLVVPVPEVVPGVKDRKRERPALPLPHVCQFVSKEPRARFDVGVDDDGAPE